MRVSEGVPRGRFAIYTIPKCSRNMKKSLYSPGMNLIGLIPMMEQIDDINKTYMHIDPMKNGS